MYLPGQTKFRKIKKTRLNNCSIKDNVTVMSCQQLLYAQRKWFMIKGSLDPLVGEIVTNVMRLVPVFL